MIAVAQTGGWSGMEALGQLLTQNWTVVLAPKSWNEIHPSEQEYPLDTQDPEAPTRTVPSRAHDLRHGSPPALSALVLSSWTEGGHFPNMPSPRYLPGQDSSKRQGYLSLPAPHHPATLGLR